MCKISLRSKLRFLTTLLSLCSLIYLTAVFAAGITQSSLHQTSCNATGHACATIDCSDDFVLLTRPFTMTVFYNKTQVCWF